ncbi:hypothetical protein FKR81_09010 [Lentzea tibetensis]|uniref:Uncharacterized protein n=1 Tax=Lentzea tibetensis TaxID=2591470 RepID=A0A563EY33_9PSEU|nr:hypothetical protein [Lentzea tibetensis]TWP52462.1 hypothetical protein FKR81_09010 [Lentzea tibetensis]
MTKGTIAIGAVLVVGLLGVAAVLEERPPPVDSALAGAVTPVVDAELQREGPWRIAGARWFCAERVVEIRRQNGELKVGVHTLCDAYITDGGGLRTVGGESGAKLVTMTEAPHRVVHVETPPDGAGNAEWIDENFSRAGAAEVHRRIATGSGLADQAASEARLAFGLPADTPIRH